MDNKTNDPILAMYIEESQNLLDNLEDIILSSEKEGNLKDSIDEIFRIMHTLKGNSAMMKFDNIAKVAHKVEDMFDFLRKNENINLDFSRVTDISLRSMDFIRGEVDKIKNGEDSIESGKEILTDIEVFIKTAGSLKKEEEVYYESLVYFEKDCFMENIRAFTLIRNLETEVHNISYKPKDIEDNDNSAEVIQKNGFKIRFKTDKKKEEVIDLIKKTAFIDSVNLNEIKEDKKEKKSDKAKTTVQNGLNINAENVDKLMNLVGELVISESMVSGNPAAAAIKSDDFDKAVRQLKKIINDIQDVVMNMRLVPISPVFKKMNRIVRDMSKNLNKDVDFILKGEDTEVDKSLIDPLSDALMHLTRNSMDHGIETKDLRAAKGKNEKGRLFLEAKSDGGDAYIILKDDGAGLDKEKIYKKALSQGIIDKSMEEMSEKDIYSLILRPGFSTNETVTQYSGRGVGMDVVVKNIESMGGKVYIDSKKDKGTKTTIKIPMSLAIIDGMLIKVGKSAFTVPVKSIVKTFKPGREDIVKDLEGNTMVVVKNECFRIIKLYQLFNINTDITTSKDGVIIMLNYEGKKLCILADSIIGEQQIVMKPLPKYIKKVKEISGCTLLGNGEISLIIDIAGLI